MANHISKWAKASNPFSRFPKWIFKPKEGLMGSQLASKKMYVFLWIIYVLFLSMYVEFQIAFQGGGSPIYDLYIPLGPSRSHLSISPPKNGFWNLMYILKKNKYIIHKNTYIFSIGNQDSNHTYYDLYSPLGTLKKWFEAFSHLKMDFGTLHTSLRKISVFFIKIHAFFPRKIETSITLVMTMFLWGPSESDLRHFFIPKWTLKPHIHS